MGNMGREGRDIRHEQRAPATVFSVAAFSHEQLRADCLPQEPGGGGFSDVRDRRMNKRELRFTFGLRCADATLAAGFAAAGGGDFGG